MDNYANTRRAQYAADMDTANAYYRESGDLAGYQSRAAAARETWHADIRAHYADAARDAELAAAIATGGRVSAELHDGQRVSVPTLAALYHVTDTTGAPAAPIIARMVGPFIVSHATIADIIRPA